MFAATTPPPGYGTHSPTPSPPGYGQPPAPHPARPPAGRGFSGRTVLALIAATVVVLLGVFLAGVLVAQGDDGDTPSGNLARTSSTTPAQVPEVPAQSQDPAAEPSSPGATETAGSGPAGTPQAPGTFINEYKNIDITDYYGIDFLDDPTRPKEGDSSDGFDLFYNGPIWADKLGVIDAGVADNYETCHANTRYISQFTNDPQAGSRWCVYTDGGLLGIVHVKAVTSDYITIDLKVWYGPADK